MTKHSHYHKDVSKLDSIDVYRLLELYEVTCPVAQHVVKKALAAGKRGAKDARRDMQDIADSANRWLQMRDEDAKAAEGSAVAWPENDARIDAIGQNGNDGEHYMAFCRHCGAGSSFPHKEGCPNRVVAG